MAEELDTITTDGRSLRRSRNRDAVLDAVVASFEEGDVDPSIDAVALRAGVSNRSIYRYFDHRDHLIRAAVGHALQRIGPDATMTDIGVGSFEQRVEKFVDHRLRLYRSVAPITRAAKVAAASEPIAAEEFEAGRVVLRQTLLEHFAEELDAMAADEQTRALIGGELAFQFDAFEFLSSATGDRSEEMRAVLVDHLRLHLGRLRHASPA
ncbi:MAG: TetR/AcrR family transcriptional regulator [Ilumatobacter sp.]|uniref:TetR/AcrR family transcriptional regulator n=1 Tax=Ilumatobacter sp. TaxID=1967498 RepID=UPI003C769B35